MVKKIKACVFISGSGTNLKSIIQSSRNSNFPIKIELIISNNIKSKGLEISKKYNISYKIIPYENKLKFEKNCLYELKRKKIKFLCLAGFLKILSANFIKNFNYKIINIHPSLLPRFKGLNTHERVLKSNEKYSGCTVHYVSSVLDSGKVILQKKILIKDNETIKTLKAKVLRLEHKAYPEAIIALFK